METEPSTGESRNGGETVYQAESEQLLTEAVVEAIASETELDVLEVADEFGPLYDAINPSALDSLFQSDGGASRSVGSVTFEYAGYRITVDSTGRVELAERQ